MEIKVSVIVPVFNVCKYLEECIDSILAQTLDGIEILCGDGGSNDGSLDILRKYEKKYSNIKVISVEGSGYGQSMNDCFRLSKGKYIGIVESDDVIKPNMYEVLYNLAVKNDLDWIRSDLYFYYSMLEDNQKLKRESIIYGADFYNVVLDPQTDYRPYKSGLRHWSGIYKSDFLRANDIYHNETPGGSYQDVGFYLKTLWYANRVMFVDQAFYMWRQDNPTSSVHYNSRKLVEKSFNEWHLNEEYLKKHRDLGKRAWASYRYRQFFSYRWTLEMAKGEDVDYVLQVFRRDFKKAIKRNEIEPEFFNEYEWGLLCDCLREFRIRNKYVSQNKVDVKERVISTWMKIGGRFLRPYKNYIRRIIDSSNDNTYGRIEELVNRRNEELVSYINSKIRDCFDDNHKEIEKLEIYCREIKQSQNKILSENYDAFEIINKAILKNVEENQKRIRGITDNIKTIMTKQSSDNDIISQIAAENQNIRSVIYDQFEIVQNEKESVDELIRKSDIICQRIEDIYRNIDKYVISPEWGKDERNKNAISNVAKLLLPSNDNKTICHNYLSSIEIEVFSKCNRKCWFCPNSLIDRYSENHYMDEEVYLKILSELRELEYTGTISFSRYNEPLIDRIILKRIEQARRYCPDAYIRTNTNGDYLDAMYLKELKEAGLNEIEIQCYFGKNEAFSKSVFISRLQELVCLLGIESYDLMDLPSDRYKAKLLFEGMNVYYFALDMKTCANNRGEVLNNTVSHVRNQNCLVPFKNLYVDYTCKYMMCCNVRSDIEAHAGFVVGDARNDKVWDVFMSDEMLNHRKKCAIVSNMSSPCCSCCYYTRDDDMALF